MQRRIKLKYANSQYIYFDFIWHYCCSDEHFLFYYLFVHQISGSSVSSNLEKNEAKTTNTKNNNNFMAQAQPHFPSLTLALK